MKKIVKSLLIGAFIVGGYKLNKFYFKLIDNEKNQKRKFKDLQNMMVRWVENKEAGKKISLYLEEMNIHTVAIYGMGEVGIQLYEELKNSNVVIEYGIDKRVIEIDYEIDIKTPDNNLGAVDAVIVTAIHDFQNIAETLRPKVDAQIISLKQIIYELNEW